MESAVEVSRQLQKQQIETAREISRSLSGLYQKTNPNEWQYLADYHSEWMQERNRLENELDGHFLNNNPAAGQEVFYRLMEHFKNVPAIHLKQQQEM